MFPASSLFDYKWPKVQNFDTSRPIAGTWCRFSFFTLYWCSSDCCSQTCDLLTPDQSNKQCQCSQKRCHHSRKTPPRYWFERWESGYAPGFFEVSLSFTYHVFEHESVISDALMWGRFRLRRCCWRECHCPIRHWITVLPQHQSCRVTGVVSFDDKLPQVGMSLCLPVHCMYLLTVLPVKAGLSMMRDLGKYWRKVKWLPFRQICSCVVSLQLAWLWGLGSW